MKRRIIDRMYHMCSYFMMIVLPIGIAAVVWHFSASWWGVLLAIAVSSLLLSPFLTWLFYRVTDLTHFMEEFHVSRLLHERASLRITDDENQIFDIGMECPAYAILLVQRINETPMQNVSRRMKGQPHNAISEQITQALAEGFFPHFTRIEQADVALIGIPTLRETSDAQQITAAISELKSRLQVAQTQLECSAYITRMAVSSVHFQLREAGDAYQEALQMIEYAIFCGIDECLLTPTDALQRDELAALIQQTAELERKFFVASTNYQFPQAAAYMQEMLETYTRHRFESVHTIKARFYGRIETVYNLVEIKLNPQSSHSEFRQEFYDEFMALMTKTQITEKIQTFFELLQADYNRAVATSGDTVADAAAYIEQHYADPDLTVGVLAQQLHVNGSYLARAFKQKRGCGVLEYLHQCRIEKIQELLRTTNLELQQIAVQVGFENGKAMSRVFKKYTGITPTAYREAKGGALR